MDLRETFFSLTPERILEAVEVGGRRATGRVVALNSMENRVYDVELEDGVRVVAKFYRPGRWSRETILEEHAFLEELRQEGVGVAAPMPLREGSTLDRTEGIFYAVFPRVRGRVVQELGEDELRRLGSLLARVHNVGARAPAPHRMNLTPRTYGWDNLQFLQESGVVPATLWPRYESAAKQLLQEMEPRFKSVPMQRLHGDCHRGNLLWDGSDFVFVDFDDMLVGPPVQDLWLIAPGRDEEGIQEREWLMLGYEGLRTLDRSTLALVEPLRALRYLHYAAWIARRRDDPAFQRVFPNFGTPRYWQQETQDLLEQVSVVMGLG